MTRTGTLALIAVLGLSGASIVAFGGIAAGGFTGFGGRTAEANETLEDPVDRIELSVSDADVEIHGSDVDRVEVRERVRHWRGRPDQNFFHLDGNVLTLDDGDCGWGCSVDYAIEVPKDVTVSGTTKSGDVVARDIAGLDVSLRSGDLELAGITGEVSAETRSGGIEGDTLSGRTVDVHARSGDIELELGEPRSVRAEANSGDVHLTVPDHAYRVTTNAGSGDVESEVRQDGSADRTLDVRTGSGDIELDIR